VAASVTLMSCRTLIVEDDPIAARHLLTLVTMLGHEAQLATSVADALAKVDEFAPECLLLDIDLPDGSGVAILEAVRAKELPVKVAIISAFAPGQPRFDAVVPLKPDAVFRKPLAIERVHDWLSTG
jgi:CheY-like chemotaxis protein